jgi:nucleoside transporter
MLGTLRKAEYAELMILFFIQAAGMSVWFVPLGPILDQYGLHGIKPYAFAAAAIASFISPLIFGAMADRHVPPAKVLRFLATCTALLMTGISVSLQWHLNRWLVLGLIQVSYLFYSPMFSISTAIVFARLADARKEFGPIRSLATFGWMAGALLVSLLSLDRSAAAGYLDAVLWLLVAAFTYFLPSLAMPASAENLSWHERLGLDALTLLKRKEVRVVFLTTTLFTAPLCAFYPYAPTHLHDLGFNRTSAWMSLAQTTEVIGMFSLAWLLHHWRLKWIFACGLALGLARFVLGALDREWSLLLNIILHGGSFVLVFITAQIYLDQKIEPAWRTRAQALLTLMNGGIGNLVGYLGTGWWLDACARNGENNWPRFWGGLALVIIGVMVYFLGAYREPTEQRPNRI